MTPRILVTGGRGFIGKAVVGAALAKGFEVRASSRQAVAAPTGGVEYCNMGNLGPDEDWSSALRGIEVVVHCAARAHVLNDVTPKPLALFRTVNVDGTLNLARQAATAGAKRFVYLSSIGVHGMLTAPGLSFSETDTPDPHNAYAVSKWEAEQGLRRVADESGLEIVIIRPPLVYGPGAPGNFGALARAVQCGWPLPLGAINNQRSLVGLDNIVEFILTCVIHPHASNQTFLVSDGEDLSTTELVRGMAQAAGRPAHLLAVPAWALQAGATVLGKGNQIQSLVGNLKVDISKARRVLGWMPPLSVAEGLRRAVSGKKKYEANV
jgi:nucleoside-diphosphate-sugar epimerase